MSSTRTLQRLRKRQRRAGRTLGRCGASGMDKTYG
jgi:hypothetical protein